jgi:hypothetical protein
LPHVVHGGCVHYAEASGYRPLVQETELFHFKSVGGISVLVRSWVRNEVIRGESGSMADCGLECDWVAERTFERGAAFVARVEVHADNAVASAVVAAGLLFIALFSWLDSNMALVNREDVARCHLIFGWAIDGGYVKGHNCCCKFFEMTTTTYFDSSLLTFKTTSSRLPVRLTGFRHSQAN